MNNRVHYTPLIADDNTYFINMYITDEGGNTGRITLYDAMPEGEAYQLADILNNNIKYLYE